MWGSMRDQEFHEGVDSLKHLTTPDLYLTHLRKLYNKINDTFEFTGHQIIMP